MPCYHPMLGVPEYRSENGNWVFVPRGRYDPKLADNWIWLDKENKRGDRPKPVMIPCGRCIGCRLDQSRSWADRMMLELNTCDGKGIFLTLTYDDDHVPFTEDDYGSFGALTLDKTDLQKFFKRFRKAMPDKEVRYYAVGEYGSGTLRPHYHAIIFGVSFDDFPDWKPYKSNPLGDQLYFSRWLQEKVWKNGICVFSDVSWKTCAYVARYVQKKIFNGHELLKDKFGLQPEFAVMSRRPGIGARYLELHPDLFEYQKIYVSSYDRGITIPKYFLDKLKLTDPELHDNLCSIRKFFAKEAEDLKMLATDLSRDEYLDIEENLKLSKIRSLKRDL